MMIPTEYQDRPVLGREIPWDNMGESAFKISHFIPFARMKDDKIDAPRPPQPYALLAAENPEFERAVLIPVVHRLDFGVAWEIFEDKGVPPEQEILVLRDRSVDSPVPRFQFAVTLKGALDKLYATGEMDENSLIGRYDPLEYDSEVTRTALGLGLLVSDARAAERPGLIPVDTFISVRMLRQLQWGANSSGYLVRRNAGFRQSMRWHSRSLCWLWR